jgi:hypothetical protein
MTLRRLICYFLLIVFAGLSWPQQLHLLQQAGTLEFDTVSAKVALLGLLESLRMHEQPAFKRCALRNHLHRAPAGLPQDLIHLAGLPERGVEVEAQEGAAPLAWQPD